MKTKHNCCRAIIYLFYFYNFKDPIIDFTTWEKTIKVFCLSLCTIFTFISLPDLMALSIPSKKRSVNWQNWFCCKGIQLKNGIHSGGSIIFSEVSTRRVSVSFCELSLANFCSRYTIFSRFFTNSSSFSFRFRSHLVVVQMTGQVDVGLSLP